MFSLFVVAFVAATIWPMASEAYVSYSVTKYPNSLVLIWLIATMGNSLGSILMFEVARLSSMKLSKKPASYQRRWHRSKAYIERYGSAVLFFAWLPVIGDILPLVAGALNFQRVRVYSWLILGKAFRYGAVIWGTLSVLQALHIHN